MAVIWNPPDMYSMVRSTVRCVCIAFRLHLRNVNLRVKGRFDETCDAWMSTVASVLSKHITTKFTHATRLVDSIVNVLPMWIESTNEPI